MIEVPPSSEGVSHWTLIVFTNTPEPTPVKTGSFMIYIVVIGILSVGLVTYYVIKKQIV